MSDKNITELKEMAVRGTDFRDDYEFEMYGEPVKAVIKPLVDNEYLPIAGKLASHLDIEEDQIESGETVEEALDEVEEAKEDGEIDMSQLDQEFVDTMQMAAIWGLHGSYDEDGEIIEYTEDECEEIVYSMLGGYSVELGSRVLEVSGDVRDANRFRGSRGSVESGRN